MISEPSTIQRLSLRSDLPRLNREGFYLFAQLEPFEQKLAEADKYALVGRAFAQTVADAERNSERPLPPVLPHSYRSREVAPDWIELELFCDLAEPFERRNRAGEVLAITKHIKARVRLFQGAFAYFTPDDLTPLETVDADGSISLETPSSP